MLKKLLALGKLILTGVFSFIFFFFLLFVIQGDWQEGRGPEIFGWTSFTILSNSMEPTFSAGDVVIMQPKKVIQEEEIVTFMTPSRKLYTHRIIDSYKENNTMYYTTKGDNNNVADEDAIVSEQIVGTHVFTIPKLGFISDFIRQPVGYGLLIIAPITMYLVLSGYELILKKRREAS
ncbi:signal peptidase I [Bacillus sp. JCM 19041]|uniref:signal peptidase I n=1 Tax=Bacillus sp. JCM 19041 TaxID=1460637 RepID=UPI0006D0EE32